MMKSKQEEVVYVTVNKRATRNVFHTDPDCRYIQAAKVKEIERGALYDDLPVCKRCENGSSGYSRQSRLTECPLCGEELSGSLPYHLEAECDGN